MLRGMQDMQRGCTWNKCKLHTADMNWLQGIENRENFSSVEKSGPTSTFVLPKEETKSPKQKLLWRECLSSSIPDLHRGKHTLCCPWELLLPSCTRSSAGHGWRVDLQAPPDIPAELWHSQGQDSTGQRGATGQPQLVFLLPARSVAGAGLKWRDANKRILESLLCGPINTPLLKSSLYNVKGLKWSGKYRSGTQS